MTSEEDEFNEVVGTDPRTSKILACGHLECLGQVKCRWSLYIAIEVGPVGPDGAYGPEGPR